MRPGGLKAGKGSMRDFLGEEEKRTESTNVEEKVTIRQGDGKSTYTQTRVANDGSKSRAEAQEVYLAEKRAAEDSIQRQDIPAGYQRYLRKYFEGISPEDKSSEDR